MACAWGQLLGLLHGGAETQPLTYILEHWEDATQWTSVPVGPGETSRCSGKTAWVQLVLTALGFLIPGAAGAPAPSFIQDCARELALLNILQITPTPNKSGSYGIKVGVRMPEKSEFGCHKSRFIHREYPHFMAYFGGIFFASMGLGGPFRAFSLHPLQKSKNQKSSKSKNGASEMISVPAQLQYKSQKWEAWKTLSLKGGDLNFRDVATSGTNHRNVSAQEFPIFPSFP